MKIPLSVTVKCCGKVIYSNKDIEQFRPQILPDGICEIDGVKYKILSGFVDKGAAIYNVVLLDSNSLFKELSRKIKRK